MNKTGKYGTDNLIPALRLFVDARNTAINSGFTDNGGAIHSVERILDILGQRICYPHLRHINSLKADPKAEISEEAFQARMRGEPVRIEHVMPQRAFAREVIDLINHGVSDKKLVSYIKRQYRLVLLSAEETARLNRQNRSKMTRDRIADAGISIRKQSAT